MVNWTQLAEMIIQSEFPSYGFCMHMAEATRLDPTKEQLPVQCKKACKALARVFELDWDAWFQSRWLTLRMSCWCSCRAFTPWQ